MKYLKLLFLLVVSITFISCSCGSGGGGGGDGDGDKIDPTITGYNVLGYGTDAFGEFASSQNLLGQVLDIDKLNQDSMLDLDTNVQEAEFYSLSGKTIHEYASSFGVSVGFEGQYKFFSGSITSTFSKDQYTSTAHSFVTIMDRIWKHSLKIKNEYWDANDLRGYLTDNAKNAINNDDFSQLFQKFGTHVMVGVYIGARLDYNLSIKITEQSDKEHLETYAKVAFKSSFASAALSASMDKTTEERMSTYGKTESSSVKGGNVQWAGDCKGEQCDGMYREWLNSIDDFPVWCGYIKDALIPIWEFADTADRRDAIFNAYTKYAEGKESVFIKRKTIITGIEAYGYPWTYGPTATIGDYKLLPWYINRNSEGGSYNSRHKDHPSPTWIYYREGYEGESEDTAINYIYADTSKYWNSYGNPPCGGDNTAPVVWHDSGNIANFNYRQDHCGYNVLWGACMTWPTNYRHYPPEINLFYSKDITDSSQPIRCVVLCSWGSTPACKWGPESAEEEYGLDKVVWVQDWKVSGSPQNLNESAHGDTEYLGLCYDNREQVPSVNDFCSQF
jgi:hypothetical protein